MSSNIQITFSLDVNAVNVVLAGLGKLPAEVSADLLVALRSEANRQVQEAQMAKEPAEPAEKPGLSD